MSQLLKEYSVLGVAALSLAGACVSESEPRASDESASDAGDGRGSCGERERVVTGSRVDLARACINGTEPLGCSQDGRTCEDAEEVVRGPDGGLWWRGDLCTPTGYSTLPTDEAQKILSYPRCSELGGAPTNSECGSTGRMNCAVGECPLSAQRVDEGRGCLTNGEPVACWPAGSSCPPVILFARDARGARWSFPGGCIPEGFTRLPEGEVAEVISLPWCDPPATTPPACDALSVETCDANTRCKIARGVQYDPMRRCRWPGLAQIACVDFSKGCSAVLTHASYADQRMPSFQFNDSCIPPKYVSRTDNEPVGEWPICPEAQK